MANTKNKKTSVESESKKKQRRVISALEWNRRLSTTEYTHRRLIFGRYANWMIKDVPTDYLKWGILNLDRYWSDFLSRELQRRESKWRTQ